MNKTEEKKIATGLKSLGKAEEKPTQLPRTMEKSLLGIHFTKMNIGD